MADGHCVYQGEAIKSAQYFRDIGFSLPDYSNPADTYMRILAVNEKDKEKLKIKHFVTCYDKYVRPGVDIEATKLKLSEPNLKEQGNRKASCC